LAEALGCRAAWAVSVPDTVHDGDDGSGRYGATILTVYGPEQQEWLNIARNIHAVNDGGRWDFDASGEPQPFENHAAYSARRIRDRFNDDMLREYLLALGIDAGNDDFYRPGSAHLVAARMTRGDREFSLDEARADW
jgi:hypothetical protein